MNKNEAIKRLDKWVEFHREMARIFAESRVGSGKHHSFAADHLQGEISKLRIGRSDPDDDLYMYEFELTHRPPKIVERQIYL